MRSVLTILALSLLPGLSLAAQPGRSAVVASLQPRPSDGPFAAAVLSLRLDDSSASAFDLASLQPVAGGPIVEVPVTLTPGQPAEVPVALPAVQARQTYRVTLLSADPVVRSKSATAEVAWPVGQLRTRRLIQPDRCLPFEADLPAWPNDTRRRILFFAALLAACLLAACLVRRTRRRLLLVALVLSAVPMLAWPWPQADRTLLVTESDGLTVYAVRRTQDVTIATGLLPVYADLGQFRRDTLLIRDDASGQLRLAPDRPRLFQPAKTTR